MGIVLTENSAPVRVLHVVTYMGRGGIETMLMNYYRHIDRSKVQFDFLVHRDFEADYDREILKLGGRIFRLPRLNPFNPGYLKRLHGFFEEHPEYQIVHVHQDCMSAVILRAAQRQGVRVRIAHAHNTDQSRNIKYPIKLFYRRFIARYATDLMACSRRAGDWMFCGASSQILYNAIDVSAFRYVPQQRDSVRSQLGLSGEELLIGHVGRFAEQKNHSYLLDVFHEIYRRFPCSKLLLVGDGPLRSRIEARADRLGIRERVVFTGVRSDVAELMQAMDIFVFPSKNEGLGIALVEAQAAGLPCVISDAVPEEAVCTDGLVSVLSLRDPPERWAEQALAEGRKARSDHSGQVKAAGFDIIENAERLEEFYLDKAEG